ncbi:calponin-2-like isoform X2 [Varroa jacobsoni]|uniref:Calponin-homology (CH) domain-containing protein n=1 Tax=Varroa destructor TaxID=109461 RepID=A0A7M7KL61_VARDE|nr:calponin-2-like isoform X3 [Varroa destructor]XP_022694876.1 calponin-2-like isoform X2 [Varroa jacobsoni]
MNEISPSTKEPQPGDRDPNKESRILMWIWNCLGKVSNTDYDQYLKDGVVLCHLMNFLETNSVPGTIEAGTDHKTKRVNIVHFLRAAQAESKPDYTGPRLGEEPADPLNMATQRRAGMPVGDDIYVAHVDIKSKIQRLRQQEAGHLPAPKTLSLYR